MLTYHQQVLSLFNEKLDVNPKIKNQRKISTVEKKESVLTFGMMRFDANFRISASSLRRSNKRKGTSLRDSNSNVFDKLIKVIQLHFHNEKVN